MNQSVEQAFVLRTMRFTRVLDGSICRASIHSVNEALHWIITRVSLIITTDPLNPSSKCDFKHHCQWGYVAWLMLQFIVLIVVLPENCPRLWWGKICAQFFVIL